MPARNGSKGKSGTSTARKRKKPSRPSSKAPVTAKAVAVKSVKPQVPAKVAKKDNKLPKAKVIAKPSARTGKTLALPVKIVPLTPERKGSAAQQSNGAITTRPLERAEGGLFVRVNGHPTVGMQAGDMKGLRAASRKSDSKRSEIVLPPEYRPLESEPFMNERHRVYFRNKLLAWKDEILRLNLETLKGLHEESVQQADPADRATAETDRALELRARDRQRKLMNKIDAALARIEDGSYGYCEETGEPISLKRLDARPIATLSIEAQEKRERRERIFRDD